MDDESAPPGGGELRRRLPVPLLDVFLTQERPSRLFGLHVTTSEAPGTLWRGLRDSPGLTIRVDARPSARPSLRLVERDGRFHDVFVALVRDLVTAAEDVVGLPPHQKPLLMDFLAARIVRWQTALKAYGDGLSTEKRAGLFGELSVLGMLLAAGVKPAVVIDGWTGPKGAVQDFQHESLAIEVKASRQTQPANVRISSERQLDLKSGSRLLLIHVGLDERSDGSGMSLPGKVAELRQFVAPEHHVGLELDDRLMEYGYLDVHAPRYSNSSYIVRGLDCFDVRDPMPRILEKNLPSGVGRVAYDLSLAACEPYRLTDERVQAAFKEVSS
ncbi:PD-(D/E)XK motif protein [Kineococcus radiotolerans]|uniref:PD-(D/E)XK motif protein n=1 Tax=Kineococcus radiotolerans TaxID=131568 RepID=UPI0021A361A0|nr:PD-(D/E)XK motif protein [Kineococcus radiotolerans]